MNKKTETQIAEELCNLFKLGPYAPNGKTQTPPLNHDLTNRCICQLTPRETLEYLKYFGYTEDEAQIVVLGSNVFRSNDFKGLIPHDAMGRAKGLLFAKGVLEA